MEEQLYQKYRAEGYTHQEARKLALFTAQQKYSIIKEMRRLGKSEISKIQRKLWELCRKLAFKKFSKNGKVDCYTCGAKDIQGQNRQLGHLWAKAGLGAFLKYDMRVLRYQCYNCNINKGGAGADFRRNIEKEIGKKAMNQLEKDRQKLVNAKDHYLKTIEEYTNETRTS